MAHVLLIDDDPALVEEQVRHTFRAPDYWVSVARDGATGIAAVRSSAPDVVMLDLRLPDRSGLDVYEEIRNLDARIPVIFITMAKTADTAIEAMKNGAFNYLYKPLDLQQLRATVLEALEVARRMRAPVVLARATPDPAVDGAIFGSVPAMLEVYKAIGRVAAQDVTVLLTGESGTGKELVARAVYQHSARSKAPFLALNCAAIPENLLESELFGHEKGAFTGADRRRIGKFEQCSGGTILLDEIGDMPLALQAKVLRLLQEQTFERVGGNETVRTDVRIIASTHRDLEARAAEEKFRPDLYYRLSVFTIHLPPLRERAEDIPLLARHYVERFSRELAREVREIAPEAMELLRSHPWPGNIRELQSVLKQAILQSKGTTLLPAFLPSRSPNGREPHGSTAPRASDLETFVRNRLRTNVEDIYADTHRYVDRILLPIMLEFTQGNHREAARLLGISRQTMRVKLRALGISVGHSIELGDEPHS
jgi:two-component system nitrogen regulation response regulator GlnG